MLEEEKLIELYRTMQTIRKLEFRIADEYKHDEMKTPVHFSIGQEAVSAGACIHLRKDDLVFGTHRFHAQYIAKGGDIRKMVAEMHLKRDGCSSGRGGSMHLIDLEFGIMGSSAIVGGSLPLGTGAALASVLQKSDRVAAVFFGDGAVDEGVFHESLNFASLKKLPVVYICENNLYAINSTLASRQSGAICGLAAGYGIPGYRIDGNDVLDVSDCVEKAVDRCRNGLGPTLIECVTYRWKGHVGTVNDVGGAYRPEAEYDYWLSKCPIKRFGGFLKAAGILDDALENEIDSDIDRIVREAFEFAAKSGKPQPAELYDYVYAQ